MNDEPTATAHVNPPQQARSRRTLERIVRAALAILDEEGPDGLTVQAVVARAKSSVGSFYARFKGKEELLEYLEERVWHEARERWQAQLAERDWSSLSLEEVARGAARLLAETHRSRAVFLKSLDRMGAGGGEGYASFRRFLLQALGALLLQHRAHIRHDDPELTVRLALAALSGIVETGDPETGERFAEDVMVREGSILVLAYLTGDAGSVEARTPAAEEEVTATPASAEAVEGRADAPDDPGMHDRDAGAVAVEGHADAADGSLTQERDAGVEDGGEEGEDEEDVDFFDVWG
jgi:AcrR family transcriptional regulator